MCVDSARLFVYRHFPERPVGQKSVDLVEVIFFVLRCAEDVLDLFSSEFGMHSKAGVPIADSVKTRVLPPFPRSHVIDGQDETIRNDDQLVKKMQLSERAHNLAEPQVREEVALILVFLLHDWERLQAAPVFLGKGQLYSLNAALLSLALQDNTLEVGADILVRVTFIVVNRLIDNLLIPVKICLAILTDNHSDFVSVFEHDVLKFEDCLAHFEIGFRLFWRLIVGLFLRLCGLAELDLKAPSLILYLDQVEASDAPSVA